MIIRLTCIVFVLVAIFSCKTSTEENLLTDYPAIAEDGSVNVVIEIPAGTEQKWEVNKTSGIIEWEQVDGTGRIVNYIGYPGNYGFIPQTLLAEKDGGDGDPLDVLVLGSPVNRGSVIKCKIIGVLYLQDRGEQDDKLIAVAKDSPFYQLDSLEDLEATYNGVADIIRLWFSNYKGPSKMVPKGFGDKDAAQQVLEAAVTGYQNK